LTVVAHIGPVPVEDLLGGCMIALAVGVPAVRAKAKARLSRRGDAEAPAAMSELGYRFCGNAYGTRTSALREKRKREAVSCWVVASYGFDA
jgi:hypothetical protein